MSNKTNQNLHQKMKVLDLNLLLGPYEGLIEANLNQNTPQEHLQAKCGSSYSEKPKIIKI